MKSRSRRPYGARRTPEQVRVILDQYERGTKPACQFAAEHSISKATLRNWRRRFGSQSIGVRRPRFVEVRNEGMAALTGAMATAHIRFGDGLTVQLCSGFDVEPVAQLVQLLRRP